MSVKLAVGFITYGELSAKYLPSFLSSLKVQTFADFKILAVDNSEEEENDNLKIIRQGYSEVEIGRAGENMGFARAHNRMIARASALQADYYLALNPDMLLKGDAVEKLIGEMEADRRLGSVSPKILKWDFANQKKTKIIDTCGIKLLPGLRFVDLGQGRADDGSFDKAEILGPSGAAALYRLSALEKVKEGDNYFDELFFMYKEDCDLAYRLRLAGFKSKCASEAIIYHDRSASAKGESDLEVALNRKNKNRQVKKWSFLNQQIIFIKYWRLQNWHAKLAIIWYEIKMLTFILLFEQYLLAELFKLREIKNKIRRY